MGDKAEVILSEMIELAQFEPTKDERDTEHAAARLRSLVRALDTELSSGHEIPRRWRKPTTMTATIENGTTATWVEGKLEIYTQLPGRQLAAVNLTAKGAKTLLRVLTEWYKEDEPSDYPERLVRKSIVGD